MNPLPRRFFPTMTLLLVTPPLLIGLARPGSVSAQAVEWDDAQSREVISAAIAARETGRGPDLRQFGAYAEGQVHYLAEFGNEAGDQPVRSDRIALQLLWRRGVGSRQTIVGRRDVGWLPTDIQYHIDHLSLVLDNFGDLIRIGDGDEVRDVLNPVAPGAPDHYQYRLVDSLSMYIDNRLTELYRLAVRPRDATRPGVVGTLHIERRSFAVARLAVTFTPSSYVDPTVESVSVDLQNALVANRYWLPAVQHVEVRRQIRFLDLPFGGTIRSSFNVLSWDLNPPDDVWVPTGNRVESLEPSELRRYMGWRTDQPDGAPELLQADSARFERIRSDAIRIVRGHYLGGTARLRLSAPAFSSLLRVRRAEGTFVGLGGRYDLDGRWHVAGSSGVAFGSGRYEGSARVAGNLGAFRVGLEGFVDRPADIGPWKAASGLVASGGALIRGEDFEDPFFETGAQLQVEFPAGGGTATVAISTARHERATLELDPIGGVRPRPLTPTREGRDTRAIVTWNRSLAPLAGSRIAAEFRSDLAGTGDFAYTRWVAEISAVPTEPDATWGWEGRGGFGFVTGDAPPQRLLMVGGRGTLPGYGFRMFAGEKAAFATVTLSRTVVYPWLRLRGLGALGWATVDDNDSMVVALQFRDSDGIEAAVGGGLSFGYDLIRLEAARGLGSGGVWEWMLSVNPQFRAPL